MVSQRKLVPEIPAKFEAPEIFKLIVEKAGQFDPNDRPTMQQISDFFDAHKSSSQPELN